jgi:hypothetical protein
MRPFVVAAFALALCACSAEPGTEPAQSSKPWYEGGTLHKATCREWLDSTPANRLATAGDFVATLSKPKTMDEARAAAEELQECITLAAPLTPSKAVAEVAVSCGG